MKYPTWVVTLVLLCALALSAPILACGSDEPTERRESARSDEATPASSSTVGGATVSPTAAEPKPASTGTSRYMLDLVPANTLSIFLLDIQTIQENRDRFPGNFQVFEEQLVGRIEERFFMEEVLIEEVEELVILGADDFNSWSYGTTLIRGNFDFGEIRASYERVAQDDKWEPGSYGGYDGYDIGYGDAVIILEDRGVVIKSLEEDVGAFLDILNSGSGSLENTEGNDLKRILDELGGSPAVAAFVEDEDSNDSHCGDIWLQRYPVAGCIAIGSAFSGSDDSRGELYVDIVAIFNSEEAAEEAEDESESITRLMEKLLSSAGGDIADHIGLGQTEEQTVSDVDADNELVTAKGTYKLGQLLPTPTPRPTRAPKPTPGTTTAALPQTTPARPQPTPSFRAQAAAAPEATPSPAASPQFAGGPGAVYRGNGDWESLAGPAVAAEFQDRFHELGDDDGLVPLDAILQHQWIFDSDYYRSLVEKARLDNPTPLTSSGQSITLKFACLNRSFYWCQHLHAFFVPNVAERTNGQVRIEVSSFPELGLAGPETPLLLTNGRLEIVEVYGGYVSGEYPSFDIQSLWGLWPDERTRFEAQVAMAPGLNRTVADDMGSQPLFRNWIANGGLFLFSREALETSEDFSGLRVRSFGAGLSDWITGMGGDPRFMAFAEVNSALAPGGRLDAGVTNANIGYRQRWYKVADYINGPMYNLDSTINAVNRRVWDSIPADLQRILLEEGARHELESLRLAAMQGITAPERITNEGTQLVEFSPEIRALSRQVALECVIPGWLDRMGHPSTGRCTGAIGSVARSTTPAATPSFRPTPAPMVSTIGPTPSPSAAQEQTLSVKAVRAVRLFNAMVGPIVGVRIEDDGTVTDLR